MTIHMICSLCGSTEVYTDACAEWDSKQNTWVVRSTYKGQYCQRCEDITTLMEINESEDLEIGFFGMVNEEDHSRLVQDNETPDFFDVMVRTTNLNTGLSLCLFEFDDQTRKEANERMVFLTALFPDAPIDWHLGILPEYKKKEEYFEVTHKQWETHNSDAPEKYSNCDISPEDIAKTNWEYFKCPMQWRATGEASQGWYEYARCTTTGTIRFPTFSESIDIFGGDGW